MITIIEKKDNTVKNYNYAKGYIPDSVLSSLNSSEAALKEQDYRQYGSLTGTALDGTVEEMFKIERIDKWDEQLIERIRLLETQAGYSKKIIEDMIFLNKFYNIAKHKQTIYTYKIKSAPKAIEHILEWWIGHQHRLSF